MTQATREQQIAVLEKDWAENPRWKGIKRGYSAAAILIEACCATVFAQERKWGRSAYAR